MKIFKNDLRKGEVFSSAFFVNRMEEGINSMNKPFIRFTLFDKTGKVSGYLWDNLSEAGGIVKEESFAVVDGVPLEKEKSLFVHINHITPADDSEIDYTDFGRITPLGIKALKEKLRTLVNKINDKNCRRLVESFLNDKAFMKKFEVAPAGKSIHHSYIGGLLEHTLSTMSKAAVLPEGDIDRDILLTSAFLHDLGKTKALSAFPQPGDTAEGSLLGHVALGYNITENKMAQLNHFPKDLRLILLHAILTHHKNPAPSPATPEAMMLPFLDGMDAKLNHIALEAARTNPGQVWAYNKMTKGRLYLVRYISQNLRDERLAA